MFKKIFITCLIVLIILFAGASFYVSTVDWNKYKDVITSEIEKISGKRIQINGKINLRFLPKPHLTAENIKIYNQLLGPNAEPIAQVQSIVMDLSLMPLLHKQFVIDKMNLTNANIVVEFLKNGKTNWHSGTQNGENFDFSNVDIAFNSVSLENSKVRIINTELSTDTTFDKVNADISGQSIVGPFRIDGNFVKDGTPAGFALNVGTLSESFATSLNLVLTHPSSESYARFDGSVLSNNTEIQGNFKVESKKPVAFVNTILGKPVLPEEYNYELASEIELKINKNQIDLPSVIMKYGDHMAGSGQVLIPLDTLADEPKKIVTSFEMTDFDVMPFVILIKDYLRQYENKKNYDPAFEYDFEGKLTARLAHTESNVIRNFEIETSLANNVWTIKKLSGLFPGDTDISLAGEVFENEKVLSYNLNVQGLSQDFYKFLEFIGYKPKTYTDSTYRTAHTSFNLSGNLNQIKLSPFEFGMDNIATSGIIGIHRANRNALFVSLQSDSISFDNYFPSFSEEENKLPALDRLKLLLNRFDFINQIDLQADLSLRLGIFSQIPFENMLLSVQTQSGKANISKLDIGQLAGAHVNIEGVVSGLGVNPTFENLKYSFETSKFSDFSNKMHLDLPQWPLFQNQNELTAQGIIAGTFEAANTKTAFNFGRTNISYHGLIHRQNQKTAYKGHLNIKTPDFIKFANQINMSYNPVQLSASFFSFDADVAGSFNDWHASKMNAFIGQNNFKGTFSYVKTQDRPVIKANIENNIFEFDRFIFSPQNKKNSMMQSKQTSFVEKPVFETAAFDYDLFKKFDLTAKLSIKNLSYSDQDIENVSMMLNITNDKIQVQNFTATKANAPIKADFSIDTKTTPQIKGTLDIQDADLSPWGGSIYAIEKGKWTIKATYEGLITSISDFIKNGKGTITFDISDPVLKGINIDAVEKDLSARKDSDKLEESLKENLSTGSSKLDIIGGDITFDKGKYALSNAVMSNASVTIDFKADGSIEAWNTKVSFSPKFLNLSDKILPFYFEWTGSLSNPTLTVDAKDLKNSYDTYWAEVKRQADEKEKARILALQNRMKEAQLIVAQQAGIIQSDIISRIHRYKEFSNNSDIKKIYESIELQVEDIMKVLKGYVLKAQSEYTDEDVDQIKLQTDVYASLLPDFIKQLDDNYLFDLKARISIEVQKISDIYQNSLEKSKNYQDTLNAYSMRLVQLGSLIVLDDLGTVKTDRTKIENAIQSISSYYQNAENLYQKSLENDKIMILDKLYQDIYKISKDTSEKLRTLNTDLEHLFEYIQDVVYFEQTGKERPHTSQKQVGFSINNTSVIGQKEVSSATSEKTPQKFEIKQPIAPEDTASAPSENKPLEKTDSSETQKQPNEEIKTNALLQQSKENISQEKVSGTIMKSGKKNKAKTQPEISNQSQGNLLKPLKEPVAVQGQIKLK